MPGNVYSMGVVAAAPLPADVPELLVSGLGPPGRRFVATMWAESVYTSASAELLRQAAKALDDCESLELPRDRRAAQRSFAALVTQLEAAED
ncbi:MAG: hypothetical protein M3545_06395 [Acidobacteriota bacterium]|nr:hypothetical protein [Acidobacteriota bacterium]